MTDEERRRTMEFILEQQAQMVVHFQQLEEDRIRDRPRIVELESSFKRLVELAEITDARLDNLELRSNSVETRSITLETRSTILETSLAALASAQAHADERVSALIDIIIEGRGGAL